MDTTTKKKKHVSGVTVVSYVVLALLSLSAILPFVLMFTSSISSEESITRNGYSFIPSEFSLSDYHYHRSNGNGHQLGNYLDAGLYPLPRESAGPEDSELPGVVHHAIQRRPSGYLSGLHRGVPHQEYLLGPPDSRPVDECLQRHAGTELLQQQHPQTTDRGGPH